MSSSGSFARKKKKEALRRLSQGVDRTPRGVGRGGGPDRGGRERGGRKRWPSDRAPGAGAKRRISVEAGSRPNPFAQQAETIFSGIRSAQAVNIFAPTTATSDDATSQPSSLPPPSLGPESSAAFSTAGTQGFGVFSMPQTSKGLSSGFGGQAVFGASTGSTGGFKFTTTDTTASFGTGETGTTGGFGAKPGFSTGGVAAPPSFSFTASSDKGAAAPSFGGGSPFGGDSPSFASKTFGQTSSVSSGFPSTSTSNFPSAGASIFGKPDQTVQSSVFTKQEETKTAAAVFGGKGQDVTNQSKESKGAVLTSSGREGSPSRRPVIDRSSILKRALTEAGDDATKKVSRRINVEPSTSGQPKSPQKAAAGATEDDADLEPYKPLARPRLSSSDSQSGTGRRFLTKEEVSTRTTLRCSDMPRMCNNKDFLRRHFSKYGKVVRVNPNLEKNTALISFADHKSAAEAKRKGRLLKKGTREITIFWGAGKTSPKGKVTTDAGAAASRAEPVAGTSGLSTGIRKSAQGAALKVKSEAARSSSGSGSERKESWETEKKPMMGITSMGKLRGMAGKNAYEKFQILEQRDRIIRQGSKKQTDLATAKAFVGTCRDMCPEKERYEREFQNRLSVYETLPEDSNKIDHAKAVKEYARSSADKEEPLPHELRPPHVLTLTMNYLVNNILDQGRDGTWGDWYDFVWNRTRGIRKDITQQLLTDHTAVDLTEKCARFHIHCAHQLCGEPMTVFDPKINNENLTKCLQSLKQFYHDLTVEGRFCSNEGEFRAYELLLNLNQGDILREVQQLRPEVRNSPQMKFALQVFSALNNNNFVRFFKLLWAAPYLPACIMHRYLTQVRTQSIKVMNRAYSITGRTSQFPLSDYMRMMGFEDEDETAIFSEAFGLAVLDGTVGFNRTTFIEGESVPRARRSAVVVSKRMVSVGEIVQGSPLPANTAHVPKNSFDGSGFFIGDSLSNVGLDTQQVKEVTVPAIEVSTKTEPPQPPASISPPPAARPPATRFSNESIKEVARELFLEVIQEFCQDVSARMVDLAGIIKGSALYVEDFIEQNVSDMAKGVVQEVVNEERARILRERLAAERAEELRHCQERVTQVVCQELVEELLGEEAASLATAQAREVLLQLKKESVERCTVDITGAVQEEVVVEGVRDVCQEVVRAAEDLRDQHLAELEQCVQLARTARLWRRWRTSYATRKRLRRSMQEFPSAPTQRLPWQKIRAFFRRKRPEASPMSLLKSWEVTSLAIDIRRLQARVRRERAWAPLDLPSFVGEQLTKTRANRSKPALRRQTNVYWKLVLSLPDLEEETPATAQLCKWLQTKLKKGSVPDTSGPSLSTDSHKLQTLSLYTTEAGEPGRKICICTKAVHGLLEEEDTDEVESEHMLLGTSAVILALPPPPEDQDCLETYWLESQLRLVRLLQAKPLHPSLPLLVLPLGWGADPGEVPPGWGADPGEVPLGWGADPGEDVREFLDVRGLTDGELVSDCRVVDISSDVEDEETCRKLCEGLSWLGDRAPLPPSLETDTLRDYVENSLAGEFSSVVYQDAAQRRKAGLPQQTPGPIVCLYNSLVEHLARVASSNNLQALSWPVAEFVTAGHRTDLLSLEWNSEAQLTLLQERILALRLPPVPYMDAEESWPSVCQYCADYVMSLPADSKEQTVLLTRLRWLLDRVQTEFEDMCYLDYDVPDCEPTACHVPWTRLVEMCVSHMVQRLDWAGEDGSMLTVHYLPEELSGFTQPTEWRVAVGNTSAEVMEQPHSLVVATQQTVRKKHLELSRVQTTDTETADKTDGKLKLEDKLSPAVSSLIRKAEELRKKIAQERMQTKSYEDQLQGYVADGQYHHQPPGVSPFSSPEDMACGTLHMREPSPSPPGPDLLSLTTRPRRLSLEENLEELRWRIEAGKRDFRLSELRLNSLLDMGDFQAKHF